MQLRVSRTISFFEEMFKNKFGFEDYTDVSQPTLFFGLYRHNDFRVLEGHKGKKIVWFAGTDSLMALDSFRKGNLDIDRYFKNTVVIAESKWIGHDLYEMGINYRMISLFIDDLYKWKAEPLGDSIYWYSAKNSKYGKKYLSAVRKAFPDIEIITPDQGTVPHDEMAEVYKKCFVGVRPVEHDGMSQTVGEMGLMGRYSIYNGDGPFSVPYEDVEGIIQAIKGLREGYNPKLISKRTRGWFIENEAKWTDLIFWLCGLDAVDHTPTFDESEGRCGSIFRIMRTSDINKIGGLGDSQYQRPWLSEQMKKLGKKQLLVSKLSGYSVGEWKNIDSNKGFPEGINFNTKDRGTI